MRKNVCRDIFESSGPREKILGERKIYIFIKLVSDKISEDNHISEHWSLIFLRVRQRICKNKSVLDQGRS